MAAKQKTSKSQIRKEIVAFLNQTCGVNDPKSGKYRCGTIHRNCLVLATSFRDRPRATPLEFFNEGLTLYIFGEGGGKIANMNRNPRVCAAIYEQPMRHNVVQKSLQVFGRAELINMQINPRLFKAKAKKWNMHVVAENLGRPHLADKSLPGKEKRLMIEKILFSLHLIKITPDHIIMREYRPDFTMPKYVWKKR